MTRMEFLDNLRTVLTGEIPDAELESNIRFYDEYIKSKSSDKTEEMIMEQLGDPRLIAKTIVETYQISHAPLYNSAKHDRAYQDVNTTEDDTTYDDVRNKYNGERFKGHSPLTWYQKLFLVMVALIVIFLLIVVGGILIRLFISIGIPILIVYMGYKLIKNGTRH